MLRLTRTHRSRISNRMAIMAAALLVAATMAGVNSTIGDPVSEGQAIASNITSNETPAQKNTVRAVKAKRGFKVNFHLFRHN